MILQLYILREVLFLHFLYVAFTGKSIFSRLDGAIPGETEQVKKNGRCTISMEANMFFTGTLLNYKYEYKAKANTIECKAK